MLKVYNKAIDFDIPKNSVYVGRPSKWGNPFKIGKSFVLHPNTKIIEHLTREQCINLYRNYIELKIQHGELDINELRGKNLVCWCKPEPCHADILLELANK